MMRKELLRASIVLLISSSEGFLCKLTATLKAWYFLPGVNTREAPDTLMNAMNCSRRCRRRVTDHFSQLERGPLNWILIARFYVAIRLKCPNTVRLVAEERGEDQMDTIWNHRTDSRTYSKHCQAIRRHPFQWIRHLFTRFAINCSKLYQVTKSEANEILYQMNEAHRTVGPKKVCYSLHWLWFLIWFIIMPECSSLPKLPA